MPVKNKTVIVVDSDLELGFLANAIAVSALSLGASVDHLLGSQITDADGRKYKGITRFPLPILKASPEKMMDIRVRLFERDDEHVKIIDFTDRAQRPQTYEEYINLMTTEHLANMQYRAIALFGPRKIINKLTGNLPLLR